VNVIEKRRCWQLPSSRRAQSTLYRILLATEPRLPAPVHAVLAWSLGVGSAYSGNYNQMCDDLPAELKEGRYCLSVSLSVAVCLSSLVCEVGLSTGSAVLRR